MTTPERGRFITLEGLEGVGKTTNRDFVQSMIEQAGVHVQVTREPGGTALGELLRNMVLHDGHDMQARTELLLVAASRVEHVEQVIEPALAQGQWVLSDRFMDASVAYQGGGRQLGSDFVLQLHELLGIDLEPDLTLLLDMPVEAGLRRMAARGTPDRIEQEAVDFFERARQAYLERAVRQPGRILIIDAGRSLVDVQATIQQALQPLLSDL
jgi:dTMP kinase